MMSIEWRRAARVAGALSCVVIATACGAETTVVGSGFAGASGAGGSAGARNGSGGDGGNADAGPGSAAGGGAAGYGGTTGSAGAGGHTSGGMADAGGAGSGATGSAACQPGVPCNGIYECTDACYGPRCCYLDCWCDQETGDLQCSMGCS